jgi:hypothetical protein
LLVQRKTVVFNTENELLEAKQVDEVLRSHVVGEKSFKLWVVDGVPVILGRLAFDSGNDFYVVCALWATLLLLLLAIQVD